MRYCVQYGLGNVGVQPKMFCISTTKKTVFYEYTLKTYVILIGHWTEKIVNDN